MQSKTSITYINVIFLIIGYKKASVSLKINKTYNSSGKFGFYSMERDLNTLTSTKKLEIVKMKYSQISIAC